MFDFSEIIHNLKSCKPVIHNITNYVTVNDCANILLACGASPIMADDPKESVAITSLADGLVINIGTLHEYAIPSMLRSGKQANLEGKPVVFDPVGVGASAFRTQTAQNLIENINFSVIRANISEIKALASTETTNGIDAKLTDAVTEDNLCEIIEFIKDFSKKINSVIIATGAIDIVSDGTNCYIIRNGNSMMSKVSGTGCMLSAVTAAFIAANSNNILKAATTAVLAMGVCGELAYSENIGNMSYKSNLIDEIYRLTADKLKERAKYELYFK